MYIYTYICFNIFLISPRAMCERLERLHLKLTTQLFTNESLLDETHLLLYILYIHIYILYYIYVYMYIYIYIYIYACMYVCIYIKYLRM